MPQNQEPQLPLEPHVWASGAMGSGRLDRTGIVYMRELRWRGTPRERLRFWLVLAIVLLFHAVLGLLLHLVMQPEYERYGILTGGPISIDLIEPETQYAPPPEMELLPPPGGVAPPVHLHREPRAPGSMSATLEGVKGPPLDLYGPEGQIKLPPGTGQGKAKTPVYRAPKPQPSPVMKTETPLPYHATKFEKDWAPSNESLGAKAFRKAVDATTAEKTVRLPGGIKVKCVASPLMLLLGCGPEPPPPPPKNDNDIRLSMPPAETLTGEKVPLPGASSSGTPAEASTSAQPAAPSSAARPASPSTAARPAPSSSVAKPASSSSATEPAPPSSAGRPSPSSSVAKPAPASTAARPASSRT